MIISGVLSMAAPAPGAAALANLREGQLVGGFRARALYLGAAGEPVGARFVHPGGLPVDLLFFASVPQISLYARTVPVGEKGDPHTLEHLLIGKGRIGKYLNSLIGMRLAEHTAATYTDLTNYQFHTSAGPSGFYELLENYLKALLHPEFTDEEIRREVCNLEVVRGDDHVLHLEEKGTVYNEMVSTMEKPDSVNWDQLGRMVFGADHPMARNQGGTPDGIRELTPEEIRKFHAANYHLGPNMALIAALPSSWKPEEFLKHLDEIINRLQPKGSAPAQYATLPPPRSLKEPEIRIGAFPSDDPNVPQNVTLAWKPIAAMTKEEAIRLSLALRIVGGGETSYLQKDLVDQTTRKLDLGITGVGTYLDSPPGMYPVVMAYGVPAANITPEKLAQLRKVVVDRMLWLAHVTGGDLKEVAQKAKDFISSSRKGMLKFMDDPPHFGDRGAGISWHRFLDHLDMAGGFKRSIAMTEVYDRLVSQLNAGENIWGAILRKADLLDLDQKSIVLPYVAAVRPDKALLAKEHAAKVTRIQAAEGQLCRRFGVKTGPEALARLEREIEQGTAAIEERDRQIPQPDFVADPPLTLDEVDYEVEQLPGAGSLIRTYFGTTPFTDIQLSFDLGRLKPEDLSLVPVLSSALSDLGVTTAGGEVLDYMKAAQRVQAEIYTLWATEIGDVVTRRRELALGASASNPDEVVRAVEWLANYLFRRPHGLPTRARLVDNLRAKIQGRRDLFQGSEESWVSVMAGAYVYQDQPLYMASRSPFTALHHLTRLRWRLEEAPDKAHTALLAAIEAAVEKHDRKELAAKLAKEHGELAEYFGFELNHLPPVGWERDVLRIVREMREDLATPASATILKIEDALGRLLCRAGVRVQMMGNRENVGKAAQLVKELLEKLPPGSAGTGLKTADPLVVARLKERLPDVAGIPVHVGLVNNSTRTGVHVISAPGSSYRRPDRDGCLDALALGIFQGAGPHSFFMQTWSAGLAYSNGASAGLATGRIGYYAERCPDLIQTMRYVAGLVKKMHVTDPFLLRYSLSNAFADYRGAGDFSSRGSAMASDLVDGPSPAEVRAFKTKLIEVAKEKGVLTDIAKRLPAALGRVIVGLGPKLNGAPGACGFVVGPEELLARYETFLKESGEGTKLIRLYPRDFWP